MNPADHEHATVNLALAYLRNLGCPVTDDVGCAMELLFGETHSDEPTAADTSVILASELMQRGLMAMQSGKPQPVVDALVMLDVAHDTLHGIADARGYTLPGHDSGDDHE